MTRSRSEICRPPSAHELGLLVRRSTGTIAQGATMSGDRDNFAPRTKRILAERSAWRCGFPGCTASTIGPSEADEAKSITLGEAAHITAAAPKGPRYDGRLSEGERSEGANGIWMCRPHAKLVDADEDMYSAETLRLWKKRADTHPGMTAARTMR